MTWFRVDDKSAFHAKVVAAGNAAWGAFCRAGAWSSDHGTDGSIPMPTAKLIEPSRKVWDRLVDVGLCERAADGFVLHDFLDWNPSAAAVEAKRLARAQAGSRGGSKRQANAKQLLEPCLPVASRTVQANVNPDPDPDPSSPVVPPSGDPPPPRRGKPKRPHTGIPADVPSWLSGLGIPPEDDPEVAKFLDHHRAKGSTFVDWAAAWRTWQRRSAVFAARDGLNGQAELPAEPRRHIPMPGPLGAS